MRKLVSVFIIIVISNNSIAQQCTGKFINPITDICWECIFPLTIGGVTIKSAGKVDTDNPTSPVCFCGDPVPRPGITTGFWEPARLVDVSKKPFCFVNLGGMEIDAGFEIGSNYADRGQEGQISTWHVHWYKYPVLYWLNILIDFICLEASGFDISYISEVDPLWQDDELTFLINPEAILFSSIIAQAACAADCVATTLGLPLDFLFWCAGCQGSLYPINGNIQEDSTTLQTSLLATERMAYKLHRQLLLFGSSGEQGLCGSYPMPIMQKSQYKTQLTNPTSMTSGNFSCNVMGRNTVFYESAKEIPVSGENFGYLIWRKRSCCAL